MKQGNVSKFDVNVNAYFLCSSV